MAFISYLFYIISFLETRSLVELLSGFFLIKLNR
jgi:hypothetical protein